MYLMRKNKPIMQIDMDKGLYKVLDENLLPYRLKGKVENTIGDNIQKVNNNYNIVIDFLSSRVLDLSRSNAKKILNAYHFTQSQSPIDKARIAIACKAISITDTFWIKTEDDTTKWEDIDPKHNSLNKAVIHIALRGSSLTLQGRPHTPELTNHGAYEKAWIREEDKTYLYKKSTDGGIESEKEISTSTIFDCFNISHIEYTKGTYEEDDVCKCENIATDELDMVTAMDYYMYCNRHGLDFEKEILKVDSDSIYKMCIMDYLVSNSDRHLGNWGFYENNNTGKLLCCHPLFDHNNAFDDEDMKEPSGGANLIFEGKTKKEVALYAISKVKLECLKVVTKSMFLNDNMYYSFMNRAVELGLYEQQKPKLGDKILDKLGISPFIEFLPTKISTLNYDKDEKIKLALMKEDNEIAQLKDKEIVNKIISKEQNTYADKQVYDIDKDVESISNDLNIDEIDNDSDVL